MKGYTRVFGARNTDRYPNTDLITLFRIIRDDTVVRKYAPLHLLERNMYREIDFIGIINYNVSNVAPPPRTDKTKSNIRE